MKTHLVAKGVTADGRKVVYIDRDLIRTDNPGGAETFGSSFDTQVIRQGEDPPLGESDGDDQMQRFDVHATVTPNGDQSANYVDFDNRCY